MGIFTIVMLTMLTPVAVIFALAGAATCGVIGGVRKLNILQSIIAGASFGLFVFPLILLIPRLLGRFLPSPVLWLVYCLACLLWLAFVRGLMMEMSGIWRYRVGGGHYYDVVPITDAVFVIGSLTLVLFVSAFTIMWSLRGIHRLNREDKGLTTPNPFPSFRYLLPSALSAIWFFPVGLVIALYVAQLLVGSGVDIQGF